MIYHFLFLRATFFAPSFQAQMSKLQIFSSLAAPLLKWSLTRKWRKLPLRQKLRSQNTPKNLINACQPPSAVSLSAALQQKCDSSPWTMMCPCTRNSGLYGSRWGAGAWWEPLGRKATLNLKAKIHCLQLSAKRCRNLLKIKTLHFLKLGPRDFWTCWRCGRWTFWNWAATDFWTSSEIFPSSSPLPRGLSISWRWGRWTFWSSVRSLLKMRALIFQKWSALNLRGKRFMSLNLLKWSALNFLHVRGKRFMSLNLLKWSSLNFLHGRGKRFMSLNWPELPEMECPELSPREGQEIHEPELAEDGRPEVQFLKLWISLCSIFFWLVLLWAFVRACLLYSFGAWTTSCFNLH